jgi:hypothetical protein
MKQLHFFSILLLVFSILMLSSASLKTETMSHKFEIQEDTCIIEGMVFRLSANGGPQVLAATIKNGHIKVVDGNRNSYRVIRYVFSISPYERVASVVRNFGSLVSYPVILDLKQSSKGDKFYFDNIVIVNANKEILNNEVKPLVLERVK